MQRALWALAALSAALSGGCHRNGAPALPTPAAPVAEERVLRIYNWSDYIGFHTIADFEHATGIKVIYDLFDSNETLEAKLLVGDSGYDIVSTSEAYYSRQIRAGLYEPLDKAQLPNWKNLDPQVLAVQSKADPGNRYAAPYLHAINGFAYNVAILMTQVLKQAGNDLSRENIMKQAANVKNFELPLLLPGIKVNTSPTDFAPIEQEQLAKFDGEKWALFGEVLDAFRK